MKTKINKQHRTRTVPEWWLAAALLQIPIEHDDGTWGPICTHEEAKKLTPFQIISLWHRDHWPIRQETAKALRMKPEEYDTHWNVAWRPITAHRRKTAEKDAPEIAKGRRISAAQEEMRRVLLGKAGQARGPASPPHPVLLKRRWPSRPIPGARLSPWKRKLNGKVERRP